MKKKPLKKNLVILFVILSVFLVVIYLVAKPKYNNKYDYRISEENYSVKELVDNCEIKTYSLTNNQILLEVRNNNNYAIDIRYYFAYDNGEYVRGYITNIAPKQTSYGIEIIKNYKELNVYANYSFEYDFHNDEIDYYVNEEDNIIRIVPIYNQNDNMKIAFGVLFYDANNRIIDYNRYSVYDYRKGDYDYSVNKPEGYDHYRINTNYAITDKTIDNYDMSFASLGNGKQLLKFMNNNDVPIIVSISSKEDKNKIAYLSYIYPNSAFYSEVYVNSTKAISNDEINVKLDICTFCKLDKKLDLDYRVTVTDDRIVVNFDDNDNNKTNIGIIFYDKDGHIIDYYGSRCYSEVWTYKNKNDYYRYEIVLF